MIVALQGVTHDTLELSVIIEGGLFVLGLITLLIGQANAKNDRIKQHAENSVKMNQLLEFHAAQLVLNAKRDDQIAELSKQTALLTEIAGELKRRVNHLEEK